MESRLLDVLAERVLIFDGAMGTQIHAAGFSDDDFKVTGIRNPSEAGKEAISRLGDTFLDGCNELLNLTRPDAIKQIHLNYLNAGADLIETNTFGASEIVLEEFEVPGLLFDISRAAGQIACEAAKEASTSDRPRFAIGAIGPGTKLVTLGQCTFEKLRSSYRTAFLGLLEAGVDALMLETLQDLLMAKATIVGAHEAMAESGRNVPLLVSVTMEQTGTMLLGTELGAALNMIEAFPRITTFGVNCATGPVEMSQHVRDLSHISTRPISVLPNAGLPVMEQGRSVYKLTPEELADHHERFVTEFGAALVGGCCGTTPAHIQAVSDRLSGHNHSAECHWRKVHHLFPGFDFTIDSDEKASALQLQGCSSLYQFQQYRQETSFLIVGEKTNANGSRAFREMLSAENWDGLTELARELEGEGSHVLDVCTAFVGRDEERDMRTLLANYNRHITVPIMIDSTEVNVVETALQCLAGKPIVNSINFEDGETRTEKILALCQKYGAAVVALTIDEDGMAKTIEKKLEIVDRILDRTRNAGLADHDVFIDCLTFTLGSGDEEFRKSAEATIEAIRMTKLRHPQVNTILGVSNVSFGLIPAARQVLNSAFLHFCLEAGLTSAIVHFSKIVPENKIEPEVWKIASDLVYDKREFAVVE